MSVWRATALAAAALALVVGIATTAAATSSRQATNEAAPAREKAGIVQAWQEFFSGSTSWSKKVALLQNGRRFAPVIRAQSKLPLARQTKAKVSRVRLQGPRKAAVRYSIEIAGQTALANQQGVALKIGGRWKIGDASFCRLLGLQGAPPRGCTNRR